MGRDRHRYNRHGRYQGKTSDKGPYAGCGGLILIAIIIWFFSKGCH